MRPQRAQLRRARRRHRNRAGHLDGPGRATIGVLLPAPGTWRLFLQMKLGGKVMTAPYTLKV